MTAFAKELAAGVRLATPPSSQFRVPDSQIEPTAIGLNDSMASLGSTSLTPRSQPPRSLGQAPA